MVKKIESFDGLPFKVTLDYIEQNPKEAFNRPHVKLNSTRYIIVHNTGDNGKAKQLVDRLHTRRSSSGLRVSWHFCIDEADCILSIPTDEASISTGNALYNTNGIAIEICESDNEDIQRAIFKRASLLIAYLAKEYSLPMDGNHIVTHKQASGKECPHKLLKSKNNPDDTQMVSWFWDMIYDSYEELSIPEWKLKVVQQAFENELIKDPKFALESIDDPAPTWYVLAVVNNLLEKLKR
jgi:N-acetylmuramoyl-L-alanine amidase CwlA